MQSTTPQPTDEIDENSWTRDPNYPVAAWQNEVENEDTERGYLEWVAARYEEDELAVPEEIRSQLVSCEDDGLTPEGKAQVEAKWRRRFTRERWMAEASEFDTRLGFESWLQHQTEMAIDDGDDGEPGDEDDED